MCPIAAQCIYFSRIFIKSKSEVLLYCVLDNLSFLTYLAVVLFLSFSAEFSAFRSLMCCSCLLASPVILYETKEANHLFNSNLFIV